MSPLPSVSAPRLFHVFVLCLRSITEQVWDSKGWLSTKNVSPLLGSGMIDLAGSSIVHVVGGLCGLWGAVMVGPRARRFVNGVETSFPAHNVALVVLGWYVLRGWCACRSGWPLRDWPRLSWATMTGALKSGACESAG